MNNKVLLLFLVSNVACFASLLDLSVPYLENSEQKAVIHHVTKSIQTSLNGRVSTQYWRYLSDGQADYDCLVAASQDHRAARPLGLVADDVKQIEKFVETYRTTEPTRSGTVDISYLKLAVQDLPAFLAKNYEKITQQVLDEIVSDDYYAYLGPKLDRTVDTQKILEAKTTRALAVEYLFQTWNRKKGEPRHYFFLLKNSNPTEQEKFKKFCMSTITEPLGELANKVDFIDNINDSDVGHNVINYSQLQYIFVRVQGNLNDDVVIKKLENIMKLGSLNPELQAVILFDDSIKEIPDDFMIKYSENISFFGKNIKKIGKCFLVDSSLLKRIDLTGLSEVTEIGDWFLSRCSSLEELDLTPLSKVQKIGYYFLSGCSSLKRIDLTGLSNVTEIGDWFLYRCISLEQIDLAPLSNVTEIGDWFLFRCISLEEIDLAPLSNVKEIGNFFLNNCISLEEIDLTPLSNVKKMGDYFLIDCSSLKRIDLTGLSNVTEIGNGFLSRCSSLEELDLAPLSKVKKIGNTFLLFCKLLKRLDLKDLSEVTEIGESFLAYCSSLKEVDLTALSNVQKVGENFLYDCHNLEKIIIPKQLYKLLLYNNPSFFKQFSKLTEENIILKDGDRSISLKEDNASSYCAIQ